MEQNFNGNEYIRASRSPHKFISQSIRTFQLQAIKMEWILKSADCKKFWVPRSKARLLFSSLDLFLWLGYSLAKSISIREHIWFSLLRDSQIQDFKKSVFFHFQQTILKKSQLLWQLSQRTWQLLQNLQHNEKTLKLSSFDI